MISVGDARPHPAPQNGQLSPIDGYSARSHTVRMETPPFGISLSPEREKEIAELRVSTVARLRPVCAGWSPEEFDALVDHVVTTTWKYQLRDRHGGAK